MWITQLNAYDAGGLFIALYTGMMLDSASC